MSGIAKHLKVTAETIAGTPRYIPSGATRTGTLTTVIGSKIVVGVGTLFLKSDVKEGDILIIDTDYKVVVMAVDSDTRLRIKEVADTAKAGVSYATEEFSALEFHATFTDGTAAIEGKNWINNVEWKMKNDYGMESVLFGGTGTITYLESSDAH